VFLVHFIMQSFNRNVKLKSSFSEAFGASANTGNSIVNVGQALNKTMNISCFLNMQRTFLACLQMPVLQINLTPVPTNKKKHAFRYSYSNRILKY